MVNSFIKKIAFEALEVESNAILGLKEQLDDSFEEAVEAILACTGKVVVTGMGKSGIIGRKIAATLSSTGTPSFYIHPGEAFHGDLGMISSNDIVFALSYSGETDEVLKLIPYLKDNHLISITGNLESTLSKNSKFPLSAKISKEACPLELAPTSSTTATLALGDTLAVVLMKKRAFKEENFAKFHPGGSLGRRLLTRVSDVMISTDLPLISEDTNVKEVIDVISKGMLGLAIVQDGTKLKGIITDGDLRREISSIVNGQDLFLLKAQDIMIHSPKVINLTEKLVEAEVLMNNVKVNSLVVINDNKEVVGVLPYKKIF